MLAKPTAAKANTLAERQTRIQNLNKFRLLYEKEKDNQIDLGEKIENKSRPHKNTELKTRKFIKTKVLKNSLKLTEEAQNVLSDDEVSNAHETKITSHNLFILFN